MLIRKFTCLVVAVSVTGLAGFTHAEDIAKSVAVRLRDSGSLDGYRVKVRAKQGTVWLEGEVSDAKNIAAAVGLAESTAGVERVVNRLAVASQASGRQSNLALPQRAWDDAGVRQPRQQVVAAKRLSSTPNTEYASSETQQVAWANEDRLRPEAGRPAVPTRMAATPRPMRMSSSAPVQPVGMRSMSRQEMISGEQVVPGSMRFYEGSAQVPAEASTPPAGMPPAGCRQPDARHGSWGASSDGSRRCWCAPDSYEGRWPEHAELCLAKLRVLPKLCCPAVSNAVFTGSVALHWPVLSVSTGAAWLA
jgi:hypothetical protein